MMNFLKGAPGAVLHRGLAWQLSGPKPHQKLLVLHEEKAEGQLRHHLHPQAYGGHQDDVGEGHEAGLLPEAVLLHAKEAADGD